MSEITGYKTSQDYALLWKVAQKQSVICKHKMLLSFTLLREYDPGGIVIKFDHLGVSDIDEKDISSFVKSCERMDIEWLVPEGVDPPETEEPAVGSMQMSLESFLLSAKVVMYKRVDHLCTIEAHFSDNGRKQ